MYLKVFVFCVFFICIHDLCFATTNNSTYQKNVNLQYHKYDSNEVPANQSSETHHLSDQNQAEISNNHTFTVPVQETSQKLKKRKKKRKRKTIKQTVETGTLATTLNLQNGTSFNTTLTGPRKKKLKKRRRKKKKNKQTQNDILEITTLRSINITNLGPDRNNTLETLIETIDSLNNITETDQTQVTSKKFNSIQKHNSKRNRCIVNNGGCSQTCKSVGKTKCSCTRGYKLAKNRKKCIDIDECRTRNGGCEQLCRNTLGTYFCDCSSGFRLSDDLRSCQDINECHLRNGHGPCDDTCVNTVGSYSCDYSHLNGTRLRNDKHTCEDINECEESNPGCSHVCVNTRIGAFCGCPDGMELMSDYKTCQDIDECEDISKRSLCSGDCINTIGSYYCEEDIQNDYYSNKTKVPVCPPLDLPHQGFITCVRNLSLPYDTFTKNGRKIIRNSPGTKCRLECPIGFRLLGEGIYICDISGKWIITKQGSCIRSPYPKLQCPPHQFFSLIKGHRKTEVYFPAPETNIRWKIVKSYPKWAKNLKGELPEGHHNIQFSVTDPASKLSSTCSFSIVIIKE